MQPFENILFAADFSENSRQAFHAACSLALEHRSRLVVVHVAEPRYVNDGPVYFAQSSVQFRAADFDRDQQQSLLEKMRDFYIPQPGVEIDFVATQGDACEEILRKAREFDSEVIVMGTHGLTGARRLVAGSVAISVLRGASCPVMAFRSAELPRQTKKFRVILHPTDFSVQSEAALRAARWLARVHDARLVIVHVVKLDVLSDAQTVAEVDPRIYRTTLKNLRRRVEGPDLKDPVETMVRRGDPAEAICQTAEEVGCDLIVMGTHGRSGLSRLLLGSVAEGVVPKAHCPVLVVKAGHSVSSPPLSRQVGEVLKSH